MDVVKTGCGQPGFYTQIELKGFFNVGGNLAKLKVVLIIFGWA